MVCGELLDKLRLSFPAIGDAMALNFETAVVIVQGNAFMLIN